MRTLEEVWKECKRREQRAEVDNEESGLPLTKYEQGKIIAYREIQYFIAKSTENYKEI